MGTRAARRPLQVENQHKHRIGGVGVDVPRRGWPLVAGVVVMLLALVVVGRLQGGNLPGVDAGGSQPTTSTVPTDATPIASGLAVAGRVALSGHPAAVAVGEDAVWVLQEHGTLLRVDPDRHRVTGRLELGAPTGPLAVGAGAVWVGNGQATMTARIDPVRLRVTARFGGLVVAVAHGVLWSYCCRRDYKATGFSRIDTRTLRPRPPLVVTDASGRRQPVGRLAVGTDAVWTQTPEDQRLWRLDPRTGTVTATTPLPDLAPSRAVGPVVGGGAVWLGGPYSGGLDDSGILVRVDPGSGRVVGWLRGPPWLVQDVLAAGPRGVWVATAGPALLDVVPA